MAGRKDVNIKKHNVFPKVKTIKNTLRVVRILENKVKNTGQPRWSVYPSISKTRGVPTLIDLYENHNIHHTGTFLIMSFQTLSPAGYFDIEISDFESLKETLETHEIRHEILSKSIVGERTHYLCRVYCTDLKKAFWVGMSYNMTRAKKIAV